MMNGSHLSGHGHVNFNDIESNLLRRFTKPAHVSLGGTTQGAFLAYIDCVNGSSKIAFRPRFHFDKNQYVAFPCDEVNFIAPETEITTQDLHSGFSLQKRSGEFFAGIPYSSAYCLFPGMRKKALPNPAKSGNENTEKRAVLRFFQSLDNKFAQPFSIMSKARSKSFSPP